MKNLRHDTLAAFVSGRLPHDEAAELFHRLAEDEHLQRRVRAIRTIQRDFDGAWAAFGDLMAEAGARLEIDPATLTVMGAIRALIDGAAHVASAAGTRVRELVDGAIAPLEASFAPVMGAASPRAGAALEHVRRASEHVAEGDDEAARRELAEAASRHASTAERATLVLRQAGAVVGEAVIDATDRSVTVTLQADVLEGVERPVAIVQTADGELRAERFTRTDGRYLARVEDVPDGVVLVQIAAE